MKEKSSIPINQEEISHYLKDIRKIKVMTPERERELAEKMISNVIGIDDVVTKGFDVLIDPKGDQMKVLVKVKK